jgi:8-oxo-dGTP pyrophosphatase MutT (NUDIX family)
MMIPFLEALTYPSKVWVATRAADKKIMPGLLECTGGEREHGEDELDTAHREMYEEAGIFAPKGQFQLKGTIYVCEWEYELFFLRLQPGEEPEESEPTKRSPWRLVDPAELLLGDCSPALGALLSIYIHERRIYGKR